MKKFLLNLLWALPAFANTPPQVINKTCSEHQWIDAIVPGVQPVCTQPSYSDLSGSPSIVWGQITGTLSSQTDLQSALNAKQNSITTGTTSQYFRGDLSVATLNTSVVPEGTNVYYTDSRSRNAMSTAPPLSYNNSTGVISTSMGTNQLIGRSSAGTGVMEQINIGSGLSLTSGTLTATGSGGTVTSVTATTPLNSSAGATPNITCDVASGSQPGCLASADFASFAAKQSAGNYITAIVGDIVATGPGSVTGTLATVNSTPGTYGSASSVCSITTNGKGLTTASSAIAIQIAESQVTNLVTDLAAKQSTSLTSAHLLVGNASNVAADVAASGDLSVANTGAFTFNTVNTNTGSWGNASSVASFTTNGKGLTTAASEIAIQIAESQVTNLTSDLAGKQSTVSFAAVGSTPSANGGGISGGTITLQPADGTHPGLLTSGSQTIGGAKNLLAALDLGSNKITSLLDPTGAQDAATKNYVDTQLSAFQPIEAATAASTASITGIYLNGASGIGATFTVTATGAFTIDGQTPAVNSRILLKDQSSGFQNGVYNLTVAGTIGVSPVLTRSFDYNTPVAMNAGSPIPVINGSTNALTLWIQTSTITTIGTDALTFSKFSGGGSGTVTAVSVVGANGLAGTVANSTTTPAITLSTSITGILQGNGTAISAASTTGTGNVVQATSPTLVTPALGTPSSVVLTSATGLPLTTGVTGVLPPANGGAALTVVSKTGNYTLLTTDNVVLCDSSGGTFTLTLPTAVGNTQRYYLKKTDSSLTAVSIATTSSQTIDSVTTNSLNTQGEELELYSDNSNWQIINRRIPSIRTAYTPTIGATTTPPTLATSHTLTAYWTRMGSQVRIEFTYVQTTGSGGAAGTGSYLIPLPTGIMADSTLPVDTTANVGANAAVVGPARTSNVNTPSAATVEGGHVVMYNATNFMIITVTATSNNMQPGWGSSVQQLSGASFASFTAIIPVSGWQP